MNHKVVFSVRASAGQAACVARAATQLGMSIHDFVLAAACDRAQEVLLDRREIIVTRERHREFMKALGQPIASPDRVMALLQRKAPWDR